MTSFIERSPYISQEDYDNVKLPNYVYPEARQVAQEIFDLWLKGTRMVVLKAQMQCGKTSVIRHLCYLINALGLHNALGVEDDSIFVLNNIVDNSLREQTRSRLDGVMLMSSLNVNHASGSNYSLTGRSSIINDITTKTIMISDESHYGVEFRGQIDQFMDAINSPLLCDYKKMMAQNNYVLLVSATPFAETSLNTFKYLRDNVLIDYKAVVTLQPSEGKIIIIVLL